MKRNGLVLTMAFVAAVLFGCGSSGSSAVNPDNNPEIMTPTGSNPDTVSTTTGTALTGTTAAADITPPSIPATFAISAATTTQMHLDWTAATDDVGVAGYKIYKGTDAVFLVEQGGVLSASTSTVVTGLAPSTFYCYYLTSVDSAGNESAKTDTKCAVTADPVLLTPQSISITPATADIFIGDTWQFIPSEKDQFGTSFAIQPVFTWLSSDPGIATVTAIGMVTAISAGTAMISANDSAIYPSLSGSSVITVSIAPTDTTSPTIVSTSPAANATNVPVDSTISVTLSEPINQATLPNAIDLNHGAHGAITYDSLTNTMVFAPDAPLDPGREYEATIAGLTDQAGNQMASVIIIFTTAS